jgi:hypothetical protein
MPPAADSGTARAFVCAVITAASLVTFAAALEWRCGNVPRFATMLLLAAAAAAVKARLPGMTGTYSGSFIFILAAIPALSVGEMIAIAAATAVVQCFWRAAARVRPIQLSFNISTLILSTVVSHRAYGTGASAGAAFGMLFAAFTYWALNTGILSALLAFLGQGGFVPLWRQWCTYSLAFHITGGAVAILLSLPVKQGDWRAALVFAPVIVFAAKYYRSCVSRLAH